VIPVQRLSPGPDNPAGPADVASDLVDTVGGATDTGDEAGVRAAVDAALDPATEAALAAATGDLSAQHGFVRLTQPEVWRFVAGLVDPGSADDLTQETYLRAFRALPGFEARSTVRTWLLGIARRVCADHIRALQRRRRWEAAVPQADPSPDHAGWYGAHDLLRALPEDRRVAFLLTQLAGLSYAEVAELEGVPVGTVRSRVARARMQLVEAVQAARGS
jgi:RNA polymerase sigma-70 factor (ECF subfamily)